MPPSTFELIKEQTRQKLTEDDKFLGRYLYYFEMRVPRQVGTVGAALGYVFPLVVPPSGYTISEPFTVEATQTQGGGLYVEENGIVQRTIQLSGQTGFKPRRLPVNKADAFPAILSNDQKSYGRALPEIILDKLSGQRHFQYLQDAVFRTYADLKRDPSTAADTHLIFHNPKDEEHWLVVPQDFTLTRDASSPFAYSYRIELLVVDKAEALNVDFSEDKDWLDSLRDALESVRRAFAMMAGAINDLTAFVGELRGIINSIDDILDAAISITSALGDLLAGTIDLITAIPYQIVESVIAGVEAARAVVATFNELTDKARTIPDVVDHKLSQLQSGLELVGAFPSIFEPALDVAIKQKLSAQSSRLSVSAERKAAAEASAAPTTLDAADALGTALTPGDVQAMEGQLQVGTGQDSYLSARQVELGQGDTLASLAARYLGNARKWPAIALINGLKPPFIDAQASAPLVGGSGAASVVTGQATGADLLPFPNALGVGSKILIPSTKPSVLDLPLVPVMGVPAEEGVEAQLLGTDLELEAITGAAGSSRAVYDIAIDADHGSEDFKTLSGVKNLTQALVSRVITDRGTNPLYQQVGVDPLVALRLLPVDLETARFRLSEALTKDPRVAAVRRVQFTTATPDNPEQADKVTVDLDVAIRGFTESKPLQVAL